MAKFQSTSFGVLTCSACGKTYQTQCGLTEHFKNIHLNISTGHTCSLCGKTFPRKGRLIHHIKRHHSDVVKDMGIK